MADARTQIWDLWIPGVGAQGAAFARGRMKASDIVLVHAVPERLNVDVRDDDGRLLARGTRLESTDDTPMCRLTVHDGGITREDVWPTEADVGRPVLLMGGEVGILTAWWNADDHNQWRWSVEFSNHR